MTISKRVVIALLAGGALLSLGAVASQAQTAPERLDVVFETRSLDRRIQTSPARFRAVGNYTQVQLQVQNLSSQPITIEYKIEWFDAEGFSVQANDVWQPVILTANASDTINSVGQVARAYAAKLTIRDPERSR